MSARRAAFLLLALGACAHPVDTQPLQTIDQEQGYRWNVLEKQAPKALADTAVILTFSGGGTRAAALADGVLRGLAKIEIPAVGGPVRLVDQIDVISSVSGGSVTAAYYALNGYDGLDTLEREFLKQDIMGRIVVRGLLDPGTTFGARIGLLESYFNERVFKGKTYGDLIEADQAKTGRRPYVVLNATDMDTGSAFSFTQDQFDLICGDLKRLKIADAVTASAAFPVALTALTLKNRAPCLAQQKAADAQLGWVLVGGSPRPIAVRNDLSEDASGGLRSPAADNLPRLRRGSAAITYLNESSDPSKPRPKDYIQLLDGGLADNLGLTRPIEMLTTNQAMPSFLNQVNTGLTKRILLVVVNARSEPPNSFGNSASPPGLLETVWTTTGTPIDAAEFHLLDSLGFLLNYAPRRDGRVWQAGVLVDFSLLADRDCRQRFHSIATSWTLPQPQVDALIAMGEAMVLQSVALQKLVANLHGTMPPPKLTVPEVCHMLTAAAS